MRFVLLSLLVPGCAENSFLTNADMDASDTGYDGYAPPSDEDGTDDEDLGGETEQDNRFLAPAATNAYVFVANPDRDTVTRISVPGLEVVTVSVGTNPTLVATTADYAKAVTFDAGSNDLAVIDAASLDVVLVPVLPNLNALELSPDGRWALVYQDADTPDDTMDDEGGAVSTNQISLVDTTTQVAYEMVVGQHPHDALFTADSSKILVISDDSLAVVDLTAATPDLDMVTLSEDPINAPRAEEVEVAPDGTYAFVRQYGTDDILVVDLVTRLVDAIRVGENPTDLDLTPDGGDAVVVCRGWNRLYLLDTADPYALPAYYDLPEGETIGSVAISPDGTKALLYTTVVATDHYTVWDIAGGAFQVRELVKPIDNVTISPDGSTALVFHTKSDADDADPDSPYHNAWALTLMNLSSLATNPLRLLAEPTEYAHTADGTHGFFIMDGQPYLESMSYRTLIVDDIPLKSEPDHVGVLPYTDWAYASQKHDLGRISFYDWAGDALQTITGFELNADIETE